MKLTDDEYWEKRIRAVRGRAFARFWFSYKTDQLGNVELDQHQSSHADKIVPSEDRHLEDGESFGAATGTAVSSG
jgi:hypothetical protein